MPRLAPAPCRRRLRAGGVRLPSFLAAIVLFFSGVAPGLAAHDASLSFNATQGSNGWRWRYSPVGTDQYHDYNAFLGGAWSKDTQYNWNWGVFHSHKRMQPGVNADAVAEFTAPVAGTLRIFSRTTARISDTYDSLDGVRIKILKNNVQLWPESGWAAVTLGREVWVPQMRVHVAAADTIRFRINCGASGAADDLNWHFDVAYESLPEPDVHMPSSHYGATQGQGGWRWQRADPAQGDSAVPVDLNTHLNGAWWWNSQYNWSGGAFINAHRMQPGTSGDVVTTFTCPAEGELEIFTKAPVRITPGFNSTDGVRIKILKNHTQLWPASGWADVGPSAQILVPTVRALVAAGDKIHFKVNHRANGVGDDTTWHFGVAYAEKYLSGAGLQADILAAYAAGAAGYTIPPGTYKVPEPSGSPAHLRFDQLSNFEINGTGVRLLFEGTVAGLRFDNCHAVTLRGLVLDYEKRSHTQGVITARTANSLTVRIDPGYPTDFDDPVRFPSTPTGYIYDPATLRLKADTGDYYATASTRLDAETFLLSVPSVEPTVQAGDLMAFRSRCGMATIFYGCSSMHVLDVTVHGGSFGLLESNGDGGNVYDHYRVAYGPTPPGAVRPRLLSTSADALHSGNMRVGPELDGCVFTGMGDDGINIHGIYGMVMGIEPPATVVVGLQSGNPFRAQDRLRVFDRDLGHRGTRTISTVSGVLAGYTPQQPSWYARFTPTSYRRLVLDAPVTGLALGDWISNPDSSGSGFAIRNSVFRDHRARGVLIKAENGLVTNCVFDGSSMHAILVTPEIYWAESGHSADVTISHNKIRGSGYHGARRPAVRVDGEAALGHHALVFSGNTFARNYAADLSLRAGTAFVVQNNTFGERHAATSGTPSYHRPHVVLADLDGVTLSGNSFTTTRFAITAEPTVTGLAGTQAPVSAFTASSAFGSVQGLQGWRWQHAPIGTNNYADLNHHANGVWWHNTANNWAGGMIQASRMQPGSTHDVCRSFVVPAAGTATLRTFRPVTVNYSGSDGVQVKILLNNTQLWPASGWAPVLHGSPLVPPDLSVAVAPGDTLRFRVNVKGTAVHDDGTWEPVVYLP